MKYAITHTTTKNTPKPQKLASVFFKFLAFCLSLKQQILKERLKYNHFLLCLSSALKLHE
ncbi:hypothetical protein [Helicobacter pylori]|uniref:hypothetical protein n=1 Tax=Helicobacter pylori TaxID=210 RepID=UPI00026B427F|nr:hypothetical protein [Helicobacter pylori]EJC15300.1 hypothetical protein HPHPP25_0459 [Helicobacter pylori Hp P-25]EJC34975.1 hypothetical protein HPHPP25C_0303 [Helicobacter pylori Hp P-25c]EJC38759.1 hypothetical protein HPHPP25D_0439 [Helicobacter pylori Hp P-25d]